MQRSAEMILLSLAAAAMLFACGTDEPSSTPAGKPAANLTVGTAGTTSVEVELKLVNASQAWLAALPETVDAPDAASLKASGTSFGAGKSSLGGLVPGTQYVLYCCPEAQDGTLGSVTGAAFKTMSAEPYVWEKSRSDIPFFADLALIYGGGSRNPKYWTPERLRSHVSWTDPDTGAEKWLFDAFLMLEGRTPTYPPHAFLLGLKDWDDNTKGMLNCTKDDEIDWLDYWFLENNGFVALDQVVGEVAARIGEPPVRRKVIVMMPDLAVHERYNITSASTTYWGEVDGRKLDFSNPADRVAAYCWYVDEVRRRFAEADFANIELGGFYIMTEELPSYRSGIGGAGGDTIDGVLYDGWEVEAKAWDQVYPAVSDYVHLYKEAVVWIPYRVAAGYRYWQDFGIDYAYMQPNRFWDTSGVNPMSTFWGQISTYKLNMELEFDDRLMVNPVDAADSDYKEGEDYTTYRKRWREYIDGMQNAGVYGSKILAYYMGSDSFNHIRQSSNAEEIAIYNEFCRLVAENPQKANNR